MPSVPFGRGEWAEIKALVDRACQSAQAELATEEITPARRSRAIEFLRMGSYWASYISDRMAEGYHAD